MNYNIDIDFDYASKCWRQNKKYKGHGIFVYTCGYIHTNNKKCRRTIYAQIVKNPYSYQCIDFEIVDKYRNHPNKHIFCKRHLNRCPIKN